MLDFPSPERAEQAFQALLRQGVIVRQLRATGLPKCLHASLGTPEDNEILVDSLRRISSNQEVGQYAASH